MYFESSTHTEAMSRMLFLVEENVGIEVVEGVLPGLVGREQRIAAVLRHLAEDKPQARGALDDAGVEHEVLESVPQY